MSKDLKPKIRIGQKRSLKSKIAGWTVVDFKTDREFDETSDRYIAQVRVYSKAVGAATNAPARGVLLVV